MKTRVSIPARLASLDGDPLKKDESNPEHGQIAPLAYENPLFLNSPDGRILRIMSE